MFLIVAVVVLLICSNLFNKLIGHLHDDVLSPLRPEFISFFFSSFFFSYSNLEVVCRLHGQTGRSTVWPNGGQNSGLENFLPISSITEKRPQTPETGIKRRLWRKWITNFSLKYSVQKNRTTFSDVPFLPGIFRRNDSNSRVPFTFQPDFLENVL